MLFSYCLRSIFVRMFNKSFSVGCAISSFLVLTILWSCNTGPTADKKVDVQTTADSILLKSIDGISQLLQQDSLNPSLYFKRAKLYREKEDFASAATDMYIALSLDSIKHEYWLFTAQLFWDGGETNRALAALDRAISIDSANIPYYIAASRFLFIDSQYTPSLAYLNKALERDIFNPEIYFYKGMVFKETGQIDKAISSFQTAVEQDPTFYDAFVQLGLLNRSRNPKLAEQYLNNALKNKPEGEDALYAKGYQQQDMKQYGEAASTFRSLVEINPQHDGALYALGYSLLMMDSLPEAYRLFDLATKANPAYAEAYYKKGVCAEQLNRKDEAITLYKNCLNLKDYKPATDALSRLGIAY